MSKEQKDVGLLATIGKVANKALSDIGLISNGDNTELSKEDVTELMMETKLEDGKAIMFEDEAMSEGSGVYLMTPEGEKIPLPAGDYMTADGKAFNVSEDGKVGAMAPAEEEAPAEEAPVEAGYEDVPKEDKSEMEEDKMEEGEMPSEMEEAPMEEEAPATELEEAISGMTQDAIAQMVQAAVKAELERLGIMPGAESDDDEASFQTAYPAEEMSKEDESVDEFKHSPTKETKSEISQDWVPSRAKVGVRASIKELLSN